MKLDLPYQAAMHEILNTCEELTLKSVLQPGQHIIALTTPDAEIKFSQMYHKAKNDENIRLKLNQIELMQIEDEEITAITDQDIKWRLREKDISGELLSEWQRTGKHFVLQDEGMARTDIFSVKEIVRYFSELDDNVAILLSADEYQHYQDNILREAKNASEIKSDENNDNNIDAETNNTELKSDKSSNTNNTDNKNNATDLKSDKNKKINKTDKQSNSTDIKSDKKSNKNTDKKADLSDIKSDKKKSKSNKKDKSESNLNSDEEVPDSLAWIPQDK